MEVAEARAAMKAKRGRSQRGFSMIEVIIVLVIIGIMVTISIPAILNFLKTYRLNGALQQVMGQLTTARQRAVVKNVHIGALWAATDAQNSAWVVEDDLRPKTGGATDWFIAPQADWNLLIGDKVQTGGLTKLPQGISFDNPANCGAGGAGNRWGIRFSSLGSACALPDAACGAEPQNRPGFMPVHAANGVLTLCLRSTSGLRRSIVIAPGGRVMAPEGFKKP